MSEPCFYWTSSIGYIIQDALTDRYAGKYDADFIRALTMGMMKRIGDSYINNRPAITIVSLNRELTPEIKDMDGESIFDVIDADDDLMIVRVPIIGACAVLCGTFPECYQAIHENRIIYDVLIDSLGMSDMKRLYDKTALRLGIKPMPVPPMETETEGDNDV